MTWLSLLFFGLAALYLYFASTHQHLLHPAPRMPGVLRLLSIGLFAISCISASPVYGFWASFFISLAGLMVSLVSLPFIDLLDRSRNAR